VQGQSGNPKGRPLRGRSVAKLARQIAQEKVEFPDGEGLMVCTRLERLPRVMWTMSPDGDLRAIRCLLEYMEGRPVQLVAAAAAPGEPQVTADDLARVLAGALERVEASREEQVAAAAPENAAPDNDGRSG
jgi:hypothetical protein